ncbi:MAG: GIY-YIG nuclease family protein [bacterium]|nr:GIY-YIG nuclease family protein [bacterium]
MTSDSPPEVDALYAGVTRLFDLTDSLGRKVGDCTRGVYLFIDYDDEPIYVGQTTEKLRTRIRRHLTNQRTDAVAMRVLDPFEVAEVEMWPFWDLEGRKDVGDTLDRAEYTVYREALAKSKFRAVLNEGEITKTELIDLPPSVRGALLSEDARQSREHPDLRLARRARTIADRARVISERQVKLGIRQTLWVQSRRLEHLARARLGELGGSVHHFDETV